MQKLENPTYDSKFNDWLNSLIKMPFGVYDELPVKKTESPEALRDYMKQCEQTLNESVYGHKNVKQQLLEIVASWISNPDGNCGMVLGIEGSMGTGKTTLIKDGVAKAIHRKFAGPVSLGGCQDSAYLTGHSFTYEGSIYGQIVNMLIHSNTMNPIIYFDELDKVSQTAKGDEIINTLIHLIDSSQNMHFQDRYFAGIDIDLSRCLFIFSYNSGDNVNPILLDRMHRIKVSDFKIDDKVQICKDYILPGVLKTLCINEEFEIVLDDNVIHYIIEKFTDKDAGGVRALKTCIQIIMMKINLALLLSDESEIDIKDKSLINFKKQTVTISKEHVDVLLTSLKDDDDDVKAKERAALNMYM
jgi:ATP-dependent Lon protease